MEPWALALALLNLLLAFYGGGAVGTALRLYREIDSGAAAARFPSEYGAACGALGGGGLAQLLLAALALCGILDSSLRRRRIVLIAYGGAMIALFISQVALGAWLVWRAQRALRVQAGPLDPGLQRLLEEVSLSEPVDALAAAAPAVLALLQAGAVAAAALTTCRAHEEMRLRRRFSHLPNRQSTIL